MFLILMWYNKLYINYQEFTESKISFDTEASEGKIYYDFSYSGSMS